MKRNYLFFTIMYLFCIHACSNAEGDTRSQAGDADQTELKTDPIINPNGMTLESRILPPEGFIRPMVERNTFAYYLRNLPVKPHGASVLTFSGDTIYNYGKYIAVVDKKIGNKDLHQCADAIMRLRAEYLYENGLYDQIRFNFTNGKTMYYSEWMKGKRIVVKGNTSYWVQSAKASNTPEDLWNYLITVFNYAGSFSLSKEMLSIDVNEMQIGDVFIKGGFPGHAVIVADMAVNESSGEKIFLLAQSYMPAQEIHILLNPAKNENPWYSLKDGDFLYTPSWSFNYNELKRFKE